MWQPRARVRGFDPQNVVNATKRGKYGEFWIEVTPRKMKGCVIGDPEQCVGAKCVKEALNATWVWMGTTTAIVGFENGQLVRYMHNGHVPKRHDGGFFIAGTYKFSAPHYHQTPEARAERKRRAKRRGVAGGVDKIGDGSRRALTHEMGIAAQMRH